MSKIKIFEKKNVKLLGFILILLTLILIILIKFLKKEEFSGIIYSNYPERIGLKVEITNEPLSVILITVDALRPDYLSFNGYDLNTSPTVDSLIRNGLYFSHAITPIPRTTQALASLLTGCYPYKTGVRYLWDKLSLNTVTLPEILKRVNYQTVAVVSNHILVPERGLTRGFDIYDYDCDKRDAIKTTHAAIKHLKNLNLRKPFFLWIHYIDPHTPYYPPKDIVFKFDPDYKGKYKTHFGQKPGGIGEHAFPKDLTKEQAVYHNDLGEEVNTHIRRLYAADIKLADMGIDLLLETAYKLTGNNLLIILTADHGESLGEHDYYYEHGDYVYNASLRVPLVFVLPKYHPKNRKGIVDDWVSLIDVLPTTLDLLCIKVQSKHLNNIDGISLIPLWKRKVFKLHPIFAESDKAFYPNSVKRRVKFDISGRFRCVIFKKWKLIWTPFQKDESLYELYNMDLDPHETDNLYNLFPEEAEKLKEILAGWMSKQIAKPQKTKPTKKDLEILKSLGYIN